MSIADLIAREPDESTLQEWLARVPYATYLGMRAHLENDDIVFVLPENKKLIGNPSLPALHGGVVGAFMEQSATFQLLAKMSRPVLPKIINFSLDYLRPVRLQDAYARCSVTRQGKMVANVQINVWQEQPQKPNATARAHFLIPEQES
jgi:uncharacterized protein (TIGR00369 family)